MDDATAEQKKGIDKKTIIDPSKSTTQAFAYNDLIQKSARENVVVSVQETKSEITEFKRNLENGVAPELDKIYSRNHHTIFIDGERGSGKTSFMLSIIQYLCSNKENDISSPTENCKGPSQLYSLGIIDPTLITGKENIFILIIGKVCTAVEEYLKDGQTVERDNYIARDWHEQLQKLARGLCMQDGVGTDVLRNVQWEDPSYILEEGLAKAQGGDKLEREFHIFINKSLKILKKEAFVIGFDDIDTHFTKGWPVLEIIRKYLTTPQLIVLLSGDYSLYSKLVRKQQWDMFQGHSELIRHLGRDILRLEIEKLEDQYLRKILPPNRRIILKSAWELPNDLSVRTPDPGKDVKLRHLMHAFTRIYYKYPPAVCKRIGELFMHMPMRNIIDMLRLIDNPGEPNANETKSNCLDDRVYNYALTLQENETPSDTPRGDIKGPTIGSVEILSVHSQMILIHYNRLIALGFTNDDLQSVQWDGRFYKLTKILYDRKLLKYGASLLPANVMQQDGLDILLMSGIYMSAMLSDIKHVFDYYVRVMIVRDLIVFIESREEEDLAKHEDKWNRIETFLDELFSPQISLMDIAIGAVRAYQYIYDNSQDSTTTDQDTGNQDTGNQDIKNTVKSCRLQIISMHEPTMKDIHKANKYLYNSLAITDTSGKQYFSPFHLIALLGLCCGTSGDLDFELQKLSHPENFEDLGAAINQPDNHEVKDDDTLQHFSNEVHTWALKYHEDEARKINYLLPPYVHSQIWRRFFDSIPVNKPSNPSNMKKCLLKAINAEEEEYFLGTTEDKHHFYNFIADCPLWKHITKEDSGKGRTKDIKLLYYSDKK